MHLLKKQVNVAQGWPQICRWCPVELPSHQVDSRWQGHSWHICCDTLLYHKSVARGDSFPSLVHLSDAGQHNDARMNLAIALTAARYGAATANYMEVVSLLKKKDPETGKERVSGARCKDVLTGMPGSTREAFLSIFLCLYNDWARIFLSLFFQWRQTSVILIIFFIVNNAWFNTKIFPCGTCQFFPFVLNSNTNDKDNNKCP